MREEDLGIDGETVIGFAFKPERINDERRSNRPELASHRRHRRIKGAVHTHRAAVRSVVSVGGKYPGLVPSPAFGHATRVEVAGAGDRIPSQLLSRS